MSYFENFPLIDYGGYTVRDITARVKLSDETLNNKFVFYPYTVPEGERADTLAYKYYNNSDYAWLVWLSNQTVDPYYQFTQSNAEFDSTIKAKYGTIERAQRVIVGFRTNDGDDISTKTIAEYNALPATHRKYWTAQYDVFSNIFEYTRSSIDLRAATNKIIRIVTDADPLMIEGEIIQVDSANYATIVSISGTTIIAHHLIGEIEPADTITSNITLVSATVVSATTLSQPIPDDERIYWKTITAYDKLQQESLDKSTINLLSSTFKSSAERQLYDLLNYR